ncbi:hypothetical protein EJ02DRAFT_221194 [Clathrospora elynae]|uniref:Dystroglycan-type cadherin-like domain-containing protein n=1 Tax=Clathrospora elynae TaxID=706981 RepID=A0A6A5SQC3_9PLEO|nr:hypothetical protein EJ02DRAFT_221194 [Clathrospora elynae]
MVAPLSAHVNTLSDSIALWNATLQRCRHWTSPSHQLLVSAGAGPTAKDDISTSLSTAGPISGADTVTVKPSKPFSISSLSDTFSSSKARLSYSVLLSERTPLPAWISFDALSMRFAGTAPPTDYPESFELLLIASDIPGFATSSVSFTMVITNHTLLFKPFSQTITVTAGSKVRGTDLNKKPFIDDSQVGDNETQSVTANIPAWLSFNNATFEIAGTAPSVLKSQDLTITAKAQSGDFAEYTIHVVFQSELFAREIGTLSLTLGEFFEYDISRSVLAKADESIIVDLASLAGYLHFDSTTLAISGSVSDDFAAQDAGNEATPEPEERKASWNLKGIVGRGSRWVSGGYWDKQGREDKVFI